jgi:hypothetical protein
VEGENKGKEKDEGNSDESNMVVDNEEHIAFVVEIIAPSDQPYQGLSKFTILSLRVLSLLSYKSKKFTLRLLFWWLCIELRIFSKFKAIAIFGNDDQFDLTTIILGQGLL